MENKLKIALIGFGKMGNEIDLLCQKSEIFQIVSVSFRNEHDGLDLEGIKKADIAIDFTSAEVVMENIETIASLGKNLVIGTTGWYTHLDSVKLLTEKHNIGLIYAPNFSIGVNIFLKMVAYSSELFSKFPDYDVYGLEIHHKGKLDSPSGTALKMGAEILKNFPSKKIILAETPNGHIKPDELHIASLRAGRNSGFHEVVFDSSSDGITLSHQAHNRTSFAKGALLAAEFIKNKKGIYTFEDVLKL